ncbi:hypothetical protein FBALC1_12462 [Flavobacteriales bacterium ALC-1]|nr:hypothetical protein FBALC1_12462 [Flavobacteriales bacterium ALC-1]
MQWSAESELMNANGVDVTLISNFSKQDTVISWQQVTSSTSNTSTFNIISLNGTWDDQNATGEINYSIISEETHGNLKLMGNTDGITATLTLFEDGEVTDTYIFQLNSLTQS